MGQCGNTGMLASATGHNVQLGALSQHDIVLDTQIWQPQAARGSCGISGFDSSIWSPPSCMPEFVVSARPFQALGSSATSSGTFEVELPAKLEALQQRGGAPSRDRTGTSVRRALGNTLIPLAGSTLLQMRNPSWVTACEHVLCRAQVCRVQGHHADVRPVVVIAHRAKRRLQ